MSKWLSKKGHRTIFLLFGIKIVVKFDMLCQKYKENKVVLAG